MERQIPEWFDDFYHRVAQYATQQDFVNDMGNSSGNSSGYSSETGESSTEGENLSNQVSDGKGGKYEVVLQKEKTKKDSKKEKPKELRVQFTSLDNKELSVNSYIDEFCGGRYSSIQNESLERIANTMSKDIEYIIAYNNVSMAKYSSTINLEEAKKLTASASVGKDLLSDDYEKISSKLNEEDKVEYREKYVPANYKVRDRIASEEDVNYYLDFIKGFREYHLVKAGVEEEKNLTKLKGRCASVKSSLDDFLVERIVDRFEKDEVLKRI